MIPDAVSWLFWEVDPSTIDLAQHRDYVLERVMSRGDLEAMRWLARTYTREELGEFVARKGSRLPPRERAFWSLLAGVARDAGPGGGRPPWADPG